MVLSLFWTGGFGALGLSVGVVSPELKCHVALLQQLDSFLWHREKRPLYAIRMSHLLWAGTVSIILSNIYLALSRSR